MASMIRLAGMMAAVAGLAACAASAPEAFMARSLPKGEQVDIRSLLAEHAGKSMCVDYQAATDSCASVMLVSFSGDVMVSQESGLVPLPEAGAAQRVEITSRSTLRNGQACVQPQDVTTSGRDEISGFLVEISRDLITQAGGSACATYFRSGNAYVISATGADGRPFATGDSALDFIDGPIKLRVK
jgi:hypothetical protein